MVEFLVNLDVAACKQEGLGWQTRGSQARIKGSWQLLVILTNLTLDNATV
jgi:hypothetical protein